MNDLNKYLMLICGKSGSGKTTSIKDISNQDKWIYACTEAGKALPFRSKFKEFKVANPTQVPELINYIITNPDKPEIPGSEGFVLDSLTFLMQMYESQNVVDGAGFKAWANYGEYFRNLMQKYFLQYNRPTIITAHIQENFNEALGRFDYSVPVKGSLAKTSVEAFFNLILYAKQVSLDTLEKYNNSMLHISEEEEMLGFKYCFQTRLTKDTLGDKIRAPIGMFESNETFIDNNVQLVINRIKEYYND